MHRTYRTSVLIAICAALDVGSLHGQALSNTPPPAPVFSIGQPPIWRQQLALQGGTALSGGGRSRNDATFSYGVFHSLNKPPLDAFNPLLGLIGGTLEGHGSIAGVEDAGLRAMATSRLLATSVGADWDIRHQRVNTILSWQSAIRRGGLLGHGSMVRVDWIPARGQTLRVGVTPRSSSRSPDALDRARRPSQFPIRRSPRLTRSRLPHTTPRRSNWRATSSRRRS